MRILICATLLVSAFAVPVSAQGSRPAPAPAPKPRCMWDGREAARQGVPERACAATNRDNVMSGNGGPYVTPFNSGGH